MDSKSDSMNRQKERPGAIYSWALSKTVVAFGCEPSRGCRVGILRDLTQKKRAASA